MIMLGSHRHHNYVCEGLRDKCCFESRCKTGIFCAWFFIFIFLLIGYLIYVTNTFYEFKYVNETYSEIDNQKANMLLCGLGIMIFSLLFLVCFGYYQKKEQNFVAIPEYPESYPKSFINRPSESV